MRLILIFIVLMSHFLYAEQNDFTQPITIKSVSQFVDGLNDVAVYKDNVVITQGSLNITADEVRIDASAGDGNEVFVALGKPASFEQRLQDGSLVRATANKVRYTRVNKKINLAGNAQLAQNSSTVTGENITFDMLNEQLIASGTDGDSGRVKAVFQAEQALNKEEQ